MRFLSFLDSFFEIANGFFHIANVFLNLAFDLLFQPFGLLFLAANQLADFFLDLAGDLFCCTFNLILVDGHDEFLDDQLEHPLCEPGSVRTLGHTISTTGDASELPRQHSVRAVSGGLDVDQTEAQLLESELFGHVKGSFTGAARDYEGLFQAPDRGTLLLDEIGDMPLPLQAKLLRVLEERKVRPVGSTEAVPVDVRIISTTHRDLEQAKDAGMFRDDLFYRLHVVFLKLPALAERREDIPLLAAYFLKRIALRYGKEVVAFSPEALEVLMEASWPGNVRQLHNVVEQVVALGSGPLITQAAARKAVHMETPAHYPLDQARHCFERDYLIQLLKITDGSVMHAARLAGRNRTEFYKVLRRHRLNPRCSGNRGALSPESHCLSSRTKPKACVALRYGPSGQAAAAAGTSCSSG